MRFGTGKDIITPVAPMNVACNGNFDKPFVWVHDDVYVRYLVLDDGKEKAVLMDFVDSFYASVKENDGVPLEDFLEFMDFLDVIWCGDTEEVTEVAAYACLNSAKLRSAVEKREQNGDFSQFQPVSPRQHYTGAAESSAGFPSAHQ